MLKKYKEQIFDLVQKGRTEQAITVGIEAATRFNPELQTEWALIQNQFKGLKRDKLIGVISSADARQALNSITLAVLELAKLFDDADNALQKPNNTILFLASNPSDTAHLQLQSEFAQLNHNLQDGRVPFELKSEWAVTRNKLQKVILQHKPRIIHFSGHGIPPQVDNRTDQDHYRVLSPHNDTPSPAGIILENESGESQEVDSGALEELFAIFAEYFKLEVVLLNACYTVSQAKAINRTVRYVIGMPDVIKDSDAIAFTSSFYMTMAMENDVELAHLMACNRLRLNGNTGVDHPVLLKKN